MTLDCTCNRLKDASFALGAARKSVGDLERALGLACEYVAVFVGACPYDLHYMQPRDCENDCGELDSRCASCWALFFKKNTEAKL